MSKRDFRPGTSTVADFFAWIDERHTIYQRKERGEPKPWTDDAIMQRWKFTNVFRQLDRGTVDLHKMLPFCTSPEHLAWTICWYRFLNLNVHALFVARTRVAFTDPSDLAAYMRTLERQDRKVFTSAHMTLGVAGETKVETYIRASQIAWNHRYEIVRACKTNTMQFVFDYIKKHLYAAGGFVAYEMVCDMRFTPLLENATDKLTWSNLGPGAKRGLMRLGFDTKDYLTSFMRLWSEAHKVLANRIICSDPPFELREIEHSLCEFDKYERVRLEQGTPRGRYAGR